MAIKITSTKNVASNGVKLLTYGKAGIGKTVLCSTATTPVIISAESGLLSLQDLDIKAIEVTTVDQVREALMWCQMSKEAKGHDTICLDSISEIAEVMITEYKKEYKDARQAYGNLADDMSRIIRDFRDLKNKHVYFSAKMQRVTDDDTGITTYKPAMPGKQLLNGLPYFFDEIFFMKMGSYTDDDGKLIKYRCLQTGPDLKHEGKDRSGRLSLIEKPDLAYVIDKIQNKKEEGETIDEE
jgi:hypothetical protein